MFKSRLLLSAMIASLAMSGVGLVGSNAAPTQTCTDIYVLGARGTGQPFDKDIGGWYSDVIGRTVNQFKAQILERAPSMDGHIHDIALTGEEFRSEDGFKFADAALQLPTGYHQSVKDAKNAGRKHVNYIINNAGVCVLFTGYSQGGQVAADLMEEFVASHPSKVLGGIFYGEPYFRGDSKYSSSGRWDTPYNARQHGGLGQRPEFSSALNGRVISTCHGKELVCQGVTWKTKTLYQEIGGKQIPYAKILVPDVEATAHSTYTRPASNPANRGLDMTEEAADSARRIVSRMGFVRPVAPAYSGPVDIVFAIDTTGSMGGEIEAAKSYVRAFPATNDSQLPNVRYGLIAYKDVGDVYVTRVDLQPTSNRADFTSAVDGLYADGGGDTPEAVFAAAQTAMGLDTRAEARKIVIFVGDAPAHDPDQLTGATLADTTSEAVRKGFIFSAVDYSGGWGSTFPEMAAATGGTVVYPYPPAAIGRAADDGNSRSRSNANMQGREIAAAVSTSDATNPLLDAVLKSVAQPQARLAIGLPAIVGKPTTINASGSSDPIGYVDKYEWDLDNDGTYDRTTDYPTVEYAFPSVGDHTVAVRVTNDIGEIGVTSASANVVEVPLNYPESVPSPPPAPSAVASDSSVTLTINPPLDGAKAGAFTIQDATTGEALATVAADESGLPVSSVVFKDLTNGVAYTYSVIAQNILGDSAPSAASSPVVPAATTAPPVTPAPVQQTATVRAPKRIKYLGRTVLLKQAVRTNAGQRAASKVTVKPKGKKYSKVRTTSRGKVLIRTLGKKKLKVTLKLAAPATSQFTAYSYTRKWTVKK